MIAKKITLRNFRNIEEAEITFDKGINVLLGDNAEGKTNLLEALYFISIGKSFRLQHLNELIKFKTKEAFISLDFYAGTREHSISVLLSNNRVRMAEKNRVRVRKMSEIVGNFRAVLFCPEHLSLIKDGPGERRNFLDIAICAAEPLYLAALQRYNHVLKQRNTLIRSEENNPTLFYETGEIWSRQLAKEGAYIAARRALFIKKAEHYIRACFADMTGEKEVPSLFYQGPCIKEISDYADIAVTEKLLYDKLTKNMEREWAAGTTLWGIHKDDVEVLLNGRAARSFCSQGQQRSLALALKLAEGEICHEETGEYPVFLFDDVLSELDRGRREYLLKCIKDKQVILTTCEGENIIGDRCILVKGGTYRQTEI